jgi:uncharacterized membrane protein (UPF0127 family)
LPGACLASAKFDRADLIINGVQYSVEIAKTSSQRSQGLMFRENLGIRAGMLFIYSRPGNHRIWMKNTLIPLLVIWLDEYETVVGAKILPPCNFDPCPSYGVPVSSKYIIELNSEVRGIQTGDKIEAVKQFD